MQLIETPTPVAARNTRKKWTLAVVCTAVFMLLLDVTIVAVALPDIQSTFNTGLEDLQWVIDAYTVPLAGLLLSAATIGDRVGRRRVFLIGMTIFTIGSLLCAVATTSLQLDLLRVVQGLGAAMLFATAMPIIGATFTEAKERAAAVGAFGASLAGASAIGPLVGGVLVDGAGWRWIFLINVPIGIATLLIGRRVLAESQADQPRRADWPGTALLTGALVALLFALIRGQAQGWESTLIIGLFVASAVLFAGFIAREATAAQPMLDLSLFARPAFAGISVASLAVMGSMVAATSYIALYFMNSLGYSPFETGLRVLPLTVASFVAAPVAARLVDTIAPRWMIGSALGLVAVGMALCTGLDADSTWTSLVVGFAIGGVGLGMASASLSQAALSSVEVSRAGMATGVVNTMRQLGTAAGVAILGVVFTRSAGTSMTAELAGTGIDPTRLSDAVSTGLGTKVAEHVPPQISEQIAHAAQAATASALDEVFWWGAVIAGVAAVISVVFIGKSVDESATVDLMTGVDGTTR